MKLQGYSRTALDRKTLSKKSVNLPLLCESAYVYKSIAVRLSSVYTTLHEIPTDVSDL